MSDDSEHTPEKAGLYEGAVRTITNWMKPRLHDITQKFIQKSTDEYAPGNDRYAKMIEFEVRRRGDGAGITQDVAEPIVWTSIKTAVAIPIAALAHSVEKGKLKMIGYGTALGLVINNMMELLRVLPRYKAGLQGSLEMAKDRWEALQETGVDPFNNQLRPREINKGETREPEYSKTVKKKSPPVQTSLMDRGEQPKQEITPGI